jgi:hypothetical protein
MTLITKVSPGQSIAITAEGIDTEGAVIEWTHPNQPKLTSATEAVQGYRNGLPFGCKPPFPT